MKHLKPLIMACLVGYISLASCGDGKKNIDDFRTASESESPTQKLFNTKCGICHAINEDKTGPALAGALKRWNNEPERLKSFIKNSAAVISSGDPYANSLYQKWNKTAMPAFTNLTEDELTQLVNYLQ